MADEKSKVNLNISKKNKAEPEQEQQEVKLEMQSEEVVYVSKRAPKFKISLAGKRHQFKDGVLRLDTEKDAEAIVDMEYALENNVGLRHLVVKTDKAAAEAKARQFLEARLNQNLAVKGATSGDSVSKLKDLQTRDQELLKQANSSEGFDQLVDKMQAETGLEMTKPGSGGS